MRVTNNFYANSLIDQLNRLSQRQSQYQTQAATGQRILQPADDPAAARRVMEYQAEASSIAQYQSNIASEQNRGNAVYTALKSLKTVSDRIGEIATLAGGVHSQQDLANYKTEVNQLIKQAVAIANTKQNGSYLFAGTRSDKPPFAMATDAAGNVTGVTYQGNQDVAQTEIAQGVTLTAQVIGANSSGSGPRGLFVDSASGVDFFGHMISLQDNLAAGNAGAITNSDAGQLSRDEDNLLFHISQNGAIQSRLDATSTLLADHAANLTQQVSTEADADLAQTMIQFNATQTAYQAALQGGAKLMSMSLMDFLR